jgi:hypothetical protein
MRYTKPTIAIFIAGLWVNVSEFFRNEILVKSHWTSHYQGLDLSFPSGPINGAVWVVWGFSFSAIIYALSTKFSLLQTTAVSWLAGFCLMWLVTWNLTVFPVEILPYAVPLSILETVIAAAICKKAATAAQRGA